MRLSIVIPTRARPAYLRRCLEALARAREVGAGIATEVMVVDDGSAEETARCNRLQCEGWGAAYRRLSRNRGMSVARAEGVAATHGTWIAFLDDDIVVARDWLLRLGERIDHCTAGVVGFEGSVDPSGDGVWDREVRNRSGGLYLTCHIVYRRAALDAAGGFDRHFEHEGPYHEDHELAARMLQLGTVPFAPELRATHLPRTVRLGAYLFGAPRRIAGLLDAELYFFLKQRDRYHLFRHERTFWRTYRAVATRHLYTTLHRRRPGSLIRHPFQSAVLVAATLIEQLCALALFPHLVRRFAGETPGAFTPWIDQAATEARWGRPGARRLGRGMWAVARFALVRHPVYDAVPVLLKAGGRTGLRLYLRIDDVFFRDEAALGPLLATMEKAGIPYLAAVTGEDLCRAGSTDTVGRIAASGGVVGLHGFTHRGRYGPFDSEILQMALPELDRRLNELQRHGCWLTARPPAFVAPFNAINALQIRFLAERFAVVCGGPETARFTDRIVGPVVLDTGGVYFPSYYPFYAASATIRRRLEKAADRLHGDVCLTVHMAQEWRDGFAGLAALIDATAHLFTSWDKLGERG